MDCFPKAILIYENILSREAGPGELAKIVQALDGKKGMDSVVGVDAVDCIWNATWVHAKYPFKSNRNEGGNSAEVYVFTPKQMERMMEKMQFMIDRYSTGKWTTEPLASTLVDSFTRYYNEISDELTEMRNTESEPTMAPNPAYHQSLVDWYASLGRGNRYDKSKVQAMFWFWPQVKHLYDDDDS